MDAKLAPCHPAYPYRMPRRRLLPPSLPAGLLALLLALATTWPALAQAPSPEKARQQLEQIGARLAEQKDDAALQGSRDAVLKIQSQAEQVISERTPQLQSLDARLAELGEAATGAGQEAAEVTRERRSLQAQRNDVDAELRQAKLASLESSQLLEQITAARQETFHDTVFERTPAIWSPRFWHDLVSDGDRDGRRLQRLGARTADTIVARWQSGPLRSAAYLGLAVLVAIGVGWFGARKLPKLVGRHIPPGRLRRSAPAVLRVLLSTLATWWIVNLLDAALLPSQPPAAVADLARLAAGLAVFAAFVTSLGSVLLAVRSPSWRLPSISDEAARALRWLPLATALAIIVAILPQRIGTLVNVQCLGFRRYHDRAGLQTHEEIGVVRHPQPVAVLVQGQRQQDFVAVDPVVHPSDVFGRAGPRPVQVDAGFRGPLRRRQAGQGEGGAHSRRPEGLVHRGVSGHRVSTYSGGCRGIPGRTGRRRRFLPASGLAGIAGHVDIVQAPVKRTFVGHHRTRLGQAAHLTQHAQPRLTPGAAGLGPKSVRREVVFVAYFHGVDSPVQSVTELTVSM